MSNHNSNVFINLISNDGFVATSKHLIKTLGLLEATLIGELCSENKYWANKASDFDGWFPSTISNIEENCGLTRKLQEKTISNLTDLNIISVKNMGLPAKRHFRINVEKLYELFNVQQTEHTRAENSNVATDDGSYDNEQNTSTNKIVPMGQTSMTCKDKQASPTGASINKNINKNINNSPSPITNNEGIRTNSSNRERTNLSNDTEIKIPEVEDVITFSKSFGRGLYVDPEWFYDYNDNRDWKDNSGKPISSWKALFSNWNSIKAQQAQKEEQNKTEAKERVQRIKTAMAKEQQQRDAERASEAAAKTNLFCPKCGRAFPDKNLRFVDIKTMACDVCKTTWSTINEPNNNAQVKAVV